MLNHVQKSGVNLYYKTVAQDLIPSEKDIEGGIDAVEEVLFWGYPNNIYDPVSLLPVVRRGITATPFALNFDNKPCFLIDASVFPGSSGSPVFIANMGMYTMKGGETIIGSRIFFLGIVSSVFVRKNFSEIEIIDVPTKTISMVKTTELVDLGMVFKSYEINELIRVFLKEKGLLDET